MFKLFANAGNKDKENGSASAVTAEKKMDFDKHPVDYALSSAYRVVNELAEDVFLTTQKMRYATERLSELKEDMVGPQGEVSALDEGFQDITTAADHFNDVEAEIDGSVSEAQRQMEQLKQDSNALQENFRNMSQTFEMLQDALDKIRNSLTGIRAVADHVPAHLREIADFLCHYREASSLFTGSGRLDACIQRQQVRLVGNRPDPCQTVPDLIQCILQHLKGLGHI